MARFFKIRMIDFKRKPEMNLMEAVKSSERIRYNRDDSASGQI